MDKLESGAVDLELRSFDMRELYEDVRQWAKSLLLTEGSVTTADSYLGNWEIIWQSVSLKADPEKCWGKCY